MGSNVGAVVLETFEAFAQHLLTKVVKFLQGHVQTNGVMDFILGTVSHRMLVQLMTPLYLLFNPRTISLTTITVMFIISC